MYGLHSITSIPTVDEISDETKRLCDVKPHFCIIKITEKKDSSNNTLNQHIGLLIGKNINDFNSLNDSEVIHLMFYTNQIKKTYTH